MPHLPALLLFATCAGLCGCTSDTSVPNKGNTPSTRDSGNSTVSETTVLLGTPVPCDRPLERPHWTERSEESGLPYRPDDGRPTEEATFLLVDDFNEDDQLDLVTSVFGESEPDHPEPVALFWGTAEGFVQDAALSIEALWQPTLGDVDGDGRRDVLLSGTRFWLQNHEGQLRKRLLSGLLHDQIPFTRLLAPIDLNQDGHLDVFGATLSPDSNPEIIRDFIGWGDSSGHFDVDPDTPSERQGGLAFTAQWIDWIGDGRPEIYVANDMGQTFGSNRLWSWDSDTPEDWAPRLGVNQSHDAMGAHIADWNNDGQPDIYLSASARNVLLVSQPDGTFVDMTVSSNADPMFGLTQPNLMGWGGIFTDHDNDGQQDLFVTLGDWWDEPGGDRTTMEIYLLQSDGEGFESTGADVGITGRGSFRGALAQDFNRDGVVDFLVSSVFGRPLWFVSDGCTANNWLEVEAPDSSRVTIRTANATRVGWASTNSGFGAITPPVARFGLGGESIIEEIEVVLPGGRKWMMDQPIRARRRVTVQPHQ